MDINEFVDQLSLQSDVVAISIVGVALSLILFLNRKRLLVGLREWRIQRCLGRIGCEQIRDLVCDDGLEGQYVIDRLVLTPRAILVISYKPFVGNIYCAEKISEWTQVVGRQSFKFENPLFELENQLTALRLLVGSAPLEANLFFNNSAEFPKGHPQAVLYPEIIPDEFLSPDCDKLLPDVRAAWDLLRMHREGAAQNSGIGVKT